MRWHGQVPRNEAGYIMNRMLRMVAARQEETRKAVKEVQECGEGEHAGFGHMKVSE